MTKQKRLITSALPYVNNLPHLGNVIGAVLSGDVFNRYSKMRGYQTTYICGTDEYGTASEVAADKEQISPGDLCARNSAEHKRVYDWFQIEFDSFGRTSMDNHKELTQRIFKENWENGNFVERTEQRFFCLQCDMFLADRYVNGSCKLCGGDQARGDQCDDCGSILQPSDILSPVCSTCKQAPELRDTVHLFFILDKFKEKVGLKIEEASPQWTSAARQIAMDWKGKDLQERCITRDLKYQWGVPVPLPEYKGKVLYVWFDAPIGYITFTEAIGRLDWWTDKNVDLYEFMGKDNVFFHSVFFPAILMGTKSEYNFPKVISSTHYLMYEKGKFSKSQGRGIFGKDLLEDRMGCAGAWRFHLLRTRPETSDSNFSWREFHESYHTMLINTIGNLCNRVLSFITKQANGCIVATSLPEAEKETLNQLLSEYNECMERTEIRPAVAKVIEMAVVGNKYVQEAFDRKLAKEEKIKQIAPAANIVLLLSRVLMPIIPVEAKRLQDMLAINEEPTIPDCFQEDLPQGHRINQPSVLFTPLTAEQVAAVAQICPGECPFTLPHKQ
ncbi:methionyl-tRNA synthetase [Nematocida homosporus]|uniref:methionyl-tRNA synthetase n=1 Tax=Nematocida homosporus TaxID=1912981 RepID=UPI00221F217B|nr:methionyl-tRNA synthetase [Nematocida homosporus]KAI5184722.1 methionyl-tRNA synthetase [Nematocida homosporus]